MTRFLIAAAFVLATLSAASAASVTVTGTDFLQTIKQLDGSDFTDQSGKPITLSLQAVCENALLATYQDEQNLTGEEKVKRYAIALKIHEHPMDAALSVEEVAMVKRLIAKSYNPLITGQSWRILDPGSMPKP